ncbi:MAG: formate dehydrogenase accessory sulfurtransferase FdhD [Rhodospirillales bacterium]
MTVLAEAEPTVARPSAVRAPATARVCDGRAEAVVETVAAEVPVAIFYNDASHAVMMASPADLEDFAIGFTLSEGIVADAGEVGAIAADDLQLGLRLDIAIPPARAAALSERRRSLAGVTGCGLCGVVAIEDAVRPLPALPPGPPVAASAIAAAVAAMPGLQEVNRLTGAVHAAAFCAADGTILALREDVGRHTALDKTIGAAARAGLDPAAGFLVVTSRCSMEMVQKAVACGCPLIAAVSAPTSLAIERAARSGLGLLAFARGGAFNVYARPERVAADR